MSTLDKFPSFFFKIAWPLLFFLRRITPFFACLPLLSLIFFFFFFYQPPGWHELYEKQLVQFPDKLSCSRRGGVFSLFFHLRDLILFLRSFFSLTMMRSRRRRYTRPVSDVLSSCTLFPFWSCCTFILAHSSPPFFGPSVFSFAYSLCPLVINEKNPFVILPFFLLANSVFFLGDEVGGLPFSSIFDSHPRTNQLKSLLLEYFD